MKCIKCETLLPDDSDFCILCGWKQGRSHNEEYVMGSDEFAFPSDKPLEKCARCGELLIEGAVRCENCGEPAGEGIAIERYNKRRIHRQKKSETSR